MRTPRRQFRCEGCSNLLAVLDESGLTIRRNDLEANLDGVFRASIRCYRRHCRRLNVLRVDTDTPINMPAA